MPNRTIRANGRTLPLASYFPDLVKAERDAAFDAIVLQVNDKHDPNPKYTEGTVSNLIHLREGPDGDGLYGDIEFADDKGVELVRKNPKVGVSVSMVENLVREEDGVRHSWPAALQHVLMTTDPHVRSMGGWHPVELGRDDVDAVIDLTNQTYEEIEETNVTAPNETVTPPAEGQEGAPETVQLELSREQADRLTAFLDDFDAATQIVAQGRGSLDDTVTPGGGAAPDASAGGATQLQRQPEEGGDPDAIELVRQEVETERQHRIDLQRELNEARAANEIDALSHTGLAPSIIEKARPLLQLERGTGTVELSRDSRGRVQSVDPTQVIRDVLREVVELSRQGLGIIDLDTEVGMHVGGEAEQADRAAKLRAMDDMFPTN